MTTVVEALMQATQDLRDAVASVLGLRADMQTLKDSTTTSATTIIQNFINRAPATTVYADINNGTDAVGFGSFEKPYKTVDYALDVADQTRPTTVYMLTDDTIKKSHTFYGNINIIGIARTPGPFALPFAYTSRKLTFAAEASDSPYAGTGRIPGRFQMLSAALSFFYADIGLPDSPAALNNFACISMNGSALTINTSTITVATAGALSRLIEANGAQRMTVTFNNVTLGANVPGKLFSGIAAGANPNSSFSYETNVTSA